MHPRGARIREDALLGAAHDTLDHGFLRLACLGCGDERLAAFSSKGRGFCPSCLGRRMADTARHLAEKVFPQVMIRQSMCSLPWRLRALLGYEKTLCSEVLRAFAGEVQRSLRRRAKKVLGLVSVSTTHTGGITSCQRCDSALRLSVHFHPLFLDGVYVDCDDGSLEFHELPEPSSEQVADVARRTATRIRVRGRCRSSPRSDNRWTAWSRPDEHGERRILQRAQPFWPSSTCGAERLRCNRCNWSPL